MTYYPLDVTSSCATLGVTDIQLMKIQSSPMLSLYRHHVTTFDKTIPLLKCFVVFLPKWSTLSGQSTEYFPQSLENHQDICWLTLRWIFVFLEDFLPCNSYSYSGSGKNSQRFTFSTPFHTFQSLFSNFTHKYSIIMIMWGEKIYVLQIN